jgi:hypothetical protein
LLRCQIKGKTGGSAEHEDEDEDEEPEGEEENKTPAKKKKEKENAKPAKQEHKAHAINEEWSKLVR